MQAQMLLNPVRIHNAAGEGDLTVFLSPAVERSLAVIHQEWGLTVPPDCGVYVMTSWWQFFTQAAPWYVTMLYLRMLPFWIGRFERLWSMSGAWTQRFGSRVAIGIKPPRLLAASDVSIGRLLFVEQPDLNRKLQQLVCHEMTHACTMRLRLPAWLNEGIAMRTVDLYAGQPTVREDTRDLLRRSAPRIRPPSYRQLARLDGQAMALHIVRGYWLVELLERQVPGFFRRQFAAWKGSRALEGEMARLLGMPPAQFWERVDDLL